MRLLAVSFATGAWWLQQQAALPKLAWSALLLGCVLVWYLSCAKPWLSSLGIVTIGLLAGFFYTAWRADNNLQQRLAHEWEGRDVRVVGVVSSLPRQREEALRFELDVEHVLDASSRFPSHLALSWYQRGDAVPAPLRSGQRWLLTLRLKRPHGTVNRGGFDFEYCALERNIGATGYVRERGEQQLLDELVWRPGYLIDRLRENIRARFQQNLHDRALGGVLIALAVGDQSRIPQAQWDLLWRSGIGHLVSISGVHITMLSALAAWLISFVWRRLPRWCARWPAQRPALLGGAVVALGYALLAGFSVPTQRTLLMLGVVAIAVWRDWSLPPSRVLAAALLTVLLFDPLAINASGFWLSFVAVAAIFYVSAARARSTQRLLPLAARVQVAVSLAMAPFLLAMFQQVPLASPLTNAIAIPIISWLVVPLTLLSIALPFDWLLQLAHLGLQACWQLVQVLAAPRWAVWVSAAPPPAALALGIVGVVWLLLPRGFPARWLGALWLLPLVTYQAPRPAPGEAWLNVLDVGQGVAVVVRTATRTLLYDAGPRYSSEADSGSRIVVPYLRSLGLTRLDALVVSHADEDHSGGAGSVLRLAPPQWLLSSLPMSSELVAPSVSALRCEQQQRWIWDEVVFEVLSPPAAAYSNDRASTNALSCVIKITAHAASALLPADLEREGELALVQRYGGALRSTVLLAPHHGSNSSSTSEFLAAVRPQVVAVSAGYRNRFGHPAAASLQRYAALSATVYRTDIDGELALRLGRDTSVHVQAQRQRVARYWRE